MQELFTLSTWTNFRPGPLSFLHQQIFGGVVIGFLVLYIATLLIRKNKKKGIYRKFWININNFFISNTIIGAFFWFFVYEEIPFLASRFWLLIWGAIMIFWLILAFKELKIIPKKKEEKMRQREFEKYIP